jgi:hypothetical protein
MAAPHGDSANAGAKFESGVSQRVSAGAKDVAVGRGGQFGFREGHEAAHTDAGRIERIAAEAALGAAVERWLRLDGKCVGIEASAGAVEGIDV